MAKTLVIIIIILLVIVAGIVVYSATNDSQKEINTKSAKDTTTIISSDETSNTLPSKYTVEITSSGFSPKELVINKGDSVSWINKDTKEHWPASAMHPTHTVYAGVNYEEEGSYQGSKACKGEGQPKTGAFDPCKGLKEGESWTFTFNEKGSWSYHDHIQSGLFGKIIVN